MNFSFADRMQGLTGSAIREIFKLVAKPDMISFAGGLPSGDSFPIADIEEITSRLLRTKGAAVLQYGITEGWPPLVETVAERMKMLGIKAEVQNVITLTGSSQGIDLATRVFINPGDVMLVESPTFLGALQTFASYQAYVRPLKSDEYGVIPEDLEENIRKLKPKLLYIIPTFQNPSGKTLPLSRRKAVAEITAKYGVMVIEDDPYRYLRYEGDHLPPIKAFDEAGNIIYLTSFSKIISPGLRVGAAIAEPEVLRKMTICKQGADTHTSNLSQAIVDTYIRDGKLDPHIDELIAENRERRDAMLALLPEIDMEYTKPEGGLFIWGELKGGQDALEVLKIAVSHGVAYIPGTHFYVQGGNNSTLRLNFSASSPDRIKEGMAKLKQAMLETKRN